MKIESCVSIQVKGEVLFFKNYEALLAWQKKQPVAFRDEAVERLCQSYGYGQNHYQGD